MKAATYEHSGRETNIQFQSTPPVKAATGSFFCPRYCLPISIHAAREGGDLLFWIYTQARRISIHAAREGGDGFGFCPCRRAERFQSTPPVKAATLAFRFKCGHGFDFNPRRP